MVTEIVAYLGAVFVAVGIVLSLAAVAAASSTVPPSLGLQGYQRSLARQNNAWFRAIEPTLLWLTARIAVLPLETTRARTRERLAAAGDELGVTPDEWIALAVMSAAGAFALAGLAVVAAGMTEILLIVVPVGVYMGVFVQLDAAALRRLRTIVRGLPVVIDLIALGTSAGLTFQQAIDQVLVAWPRSHDALCDELRLMQRQLQLGTTRRAVLAELARRVPAPEVYDFTAAVVQAEAKGTPLREVLSVQATVMRQRQTFDAEERSSKAAMKMMIPLVLLLAATFVIIIAPVLLSAQKWM